MTMVVGPGQSIESEVAWARGEAETIAAMGAINLATARLVETIVTLIATNGWVGHGIHSVEQWVMWKADVARRRAEGLVRIARRCEDLPVCWALFCEGRLTEDAMTRIARRVPASHDEQVAAIAPGLLISQLTRVLSALPPLEEEPEPQPEYFVRTYTAADGSGRGEWCLPPDEHALAMAALTAAHDREFRDRNDLPADVETPQGEVARVSWRDAFVRLCSDVADALDATLARTGHRGERHQIVLHHQVDAQGQVGPGRLHLGPFVDRDTSRFLACDAQVLVVAWQNGKLIGITPTERTPNRRLRRALEHRDGGCAHALCVQKLWLHAHHIQHWEDGGPTVAANLVMLCPQHHRALHSGDLSIEGSPEDGTLVFRDSRGERIEPPRFGADPLPPPEPHQLQYRQPYGERLSSRDFSWN